MELLQSTCAIAALRPIPPRPVYASDHQRTDLCVPGMKTHFGNRAFSATGPEPRCRTSLPFVIRFADSLEKPISPSLLRERAHNFVLPPRDNRNFVSRALYKALDLYNP